MEVEFGKDNIEKDVENNNIRIEEPNYKPAKPSNYRLTPESSDSESAKDHDRNENEKYGPRPLTRVDYLKMFLTESISTSDEPSLSAQ